MDLGLGGCLPLPTIVSDEIRFLGFVNFRAELADFEGVVQISASPSSVAGLSLIQETDGDIAASAIRILARAGAAGHVAA